jgi:glutathione S-transferase
MLKVYGQARSRAFRVLWLCKESNIAYEHVPVTINVEGAQCKEAWFAAINPNLRVPAIEDDGVVMWESAAINLYLAEKYRSPLWPTSAAGRAAMLQWAFFIANDVEPSMITVLQNRVMFPPEKRNATLADAHDAALQPKLKVLDEHLARAKFFGDGRWEMADFMVASVCYTFFAMKHDLAAFPAFRDWLLASVERPMAKEARKLRE